jgi:hypothetical protein
MLDTIESLSSTTVKVYCQKKTRQNLNKQTKKGEYSKVPKVTQEDRGTMGNKKFINQYKNTIRRPITHYFFIISLILENPSILK